MEYNAGWDVNYDGYDYETGCIDFDESKWKDWYKKRVENKNSFYAYVYNNQTPIGEVSFSDKGEISIIIEAKYRGKGYAKTALKLLIEKAFKEYNIEVLRDTLPKDRKNAIKLFEEIGFPIIKEYKSKRFNKPCDMVMLELKKER